MDSQRRNIMELFIINYPKEQILDGTNSNSNSNSLLIKKAP
jgi:hypothetical protein